MGFQAGAVYALLGGQFNPAGFVAFDGAIKKSAANMQAAEASIAGSAKRSSAAVGGLGTAASTAAKGGFVALGAAVAGSVTAAARFEKQMSAVQAVTKASEADMKRMADAAKALGQESGLGATKTAKAIEELAKGGLTTSQILKGGLKGAIDLALAGQIDLATAAETTANALNLFGLKGSDASHVADALATAANKTTADVADFAIALSQGGGAAKAAGLSFDDTIVALEALALSGVKGSDAGTSLKAAFSQIVNPTKESARVMKDLGLEFFTAEGKIKPVKALAGELKDGLKDLTNEQRLSALQTIAGTDGFRALLALFEQGPGKIGGLKKGLEDQGTATDVATEKSDNLAGAWGRLKGALENIGIDAGTPLLDGLKSGLDDAATAIEDFRERVEKDGGTETIADMLGIDPADVGAVTGAIGEIGGAIGSIQFDAVTNRLGTLGGVVGGVVGTIGSLLRGDFAGAFESAKGAVSAFADGVVGSLAPIAELIAAPIRAGVDVVLGLFSTLASAVADFYGALSTLPGGGIFKGAKETFTWMANDINDLRASLKGLEDKDVKVTANTGPALAELEVLNELDVQEKIAKILASDDDAKTKIRKIAEIRDLPPKYAEIIGRDGDVKGKIAALRAMPVPDIRIPVSFFLANSLSGLVGSAPRPAGPRIPASKRAAGRGPIGAETALVGEGRVPREYVVDPVTGTVQRVDSPQLMGLPQSAYVIPTDPGMRGRSLGLFTEMARDLGIPGFAKGKKPAKKTARKKRDLPTSQQIFRSDASDLDQIADNATGRLEDAKRAADDKDSKGKPTAAARRARSQIPKLRAEAKRRRDIARRAREHADRISAQDELAEIARNDMVLADQRDDQVGYDAAKKRRARALGQAAKLLAQAMGFAPKDSAFARDLAKRLGGVQISAGDLAGDLMQVDAPGEPVETPAQKAAREAAERLADTGMTDQERKRLEDLEAVRALAGLTSGLDDDKAAAGGLAEFLGNVLNAALVDPARGGSPVIKTLAERLASARGELETLTTGRGQVDNQDLQAQIEQANERARVAQAESAANIAALAAFTSSGDIGTGRYANARDAGAQITINTLHPGDPRVLDAIGRAATIGQDMQRSSPNVPVRSGY